VDFEITPDDVAAYNDYIARGGEHAYEPYADGGLVTAGTSWFALLEEEFVFTDAQLEAIRAVARELDIFSTTAGDS
jgi:hypothetical protein